MSVDEARRLLLHDAARTAWGAGAALVLMEMLPPTGWGDVATRQQLEASDIATRQQLEAVEERFGQKLEHGIDSLRLEMRAEFADSQRHMIQWMVATVIATTGVAIGLATAIARLT